MNPRTILGISMFCLISITSCEKSEVLPQISQKQENAGTGIFKLVSSELVNGKNSSLKASSNLDYETQYDYAHGIHRYIFYGSYYNIDHFYDSQKANTINHDNHTYQYEGKEFSICTHLWGTNKITELYRYYSSELNDHVLSTAQSVSGYTKETTLGEIFTFQEIGTVPLKEFYSSKRNKHLYSCRNSEIEGWIPENDPDFKYTKTVGYVYPGRIDPMKTATKLIFECVPENNDPYPEIPKEITVDIKAFEGDNIYKLTYTAQTTSNGNATLTLPNTYSVICLNATFKYDYHTNYCEDIAAYDYTEIGYNYDYVRNSIGINRVYNGYNNTFKYTYFEIPVGTEDESE